MFNWLKKLFGKKDESLNEAFPFPTAKGQDQSHLAPYKVESPVTTVASGNETLGNNTVSTVPKKVTTRKEGAPKKTTTKKSAPKRTSNKTGTGSRRGRKPKTGA